jgi:hypothetical protein
MTDFATDLLWEEQKDPALPVPGRPRERQQNRHRTAHPMPPAAESLTDRLQRVAGNAALARQAAEAENAHKHQGQVAQQAKAEAPPAPAAATAPADHKAVQQQVAQIAVAADSRRRQEDAKAAAARAAALDQVLASFEHDPSKADLLTLALLVEKAPPGVAQATARALVHAVMRADPAHRAAIHVRIRTQLADHHRNLTLARLLTDQLAALGPRPARAAPAPPPAPPPH